VELAPWRPFRELGSFSKDVDKIWDRFFSDKLLGRMPTEEWFPTVDISETKDKLLIKAELPGLDAKDVDVTMSGDILTIKGEKKKEEEQKDEHYYSCERYTGSFQRSFRLPVNIKADKIEASFEKGVLRITLPKTEEAKKKKIEIKAK
jgi:HSP20 family protein